MGSDFLPFLSVVLLGLAFTFLFLHVLSTKQQQRNLPYGSMGWPFLGETLSFLKPHNSNTIGTFLQDHCSRYGKVFRSHLFGSSTIISCDQDLNAFVLQNEEKLFECSYPKPIHGILGKLSMLVVVGNEHKRLRSIALSLTSTWKSKPEYLHDIDKQAISAMESWKKREEVIFCDETRKFSFNVIVKQILSLEPEEPQTTKILEDFLTFMKGLVSFPIYIPGTPYAKAVRARARISTTVGVMVDERRKMVEGQEKGDFLDVLLSNTSLSDEEKVSLVLDLLLGGYETTSLLMALAVYFLERSPPALEQLKVEHQAIRKRKEEGEHLNWEDYKQMEVTQNVINEALRCGNIVKFVHRKALKDVRFKGYLIPSGWKVLPVFSAVHLDPSLHENPSEFCPSRWVGHMTCKKMTPFGGGPRLCPAAELAKVETAFFLHHLVLKYRWRTKGEDYPVAFPYVEFQRGLPLLIEPLEEEI
ncbi:cytochrome P450, family 724, subfamily A, polypeptide 1 [Tasmannia lanceolata]|uniref:cytochrome P450, family 724, subfamily A, polypeptide 1 n=1 Tax=Tasmannia lanceolata TaxID=3420 RepID=UPI004064544E